VLVAAISLLHILWHLFILNLPLKRIARLLSFTAIVALLIGPVLIINVVLKNHYGRTRPVHITEFEGKARFTSVFTLSDQCKQNCSFSSGHAAGAFFLCIFAMGRRSKMLWLLTGSLALLTCLARISQGGHFISDAYASGVIVLWVNYFCLKFLYSHSKHANPG